MAGHERKVAVERKSLNDFVQSITRGRKRFERECLRLLGMEYRALVIEASLQTIVNESYRSKVPHSAVIGSMVALSIDYELPCFLAGGRIEAERLTVAWLKNVLKRI